MRRRGFTRFIAALVVLVPYGAVAQSQKLPKIGILAIGPPNTASIEMFHRGLRELGWIDGQNVIIETRGRETASELPEAAAELARAKVDVIFAGTSTHVEAARQA